MSVYLYLFHGRDRFDQDMDAWGRECPAIGPLSYVHTTYGGDVKLRGAREVMEEELAMPVAIDIADWQPIAPAALPPEAAGPILEALSRAKKELACR